ncbi:MAG: ABC transporter permease [Acidobacteria bacterium]|nr:ABC transporter permease [Acidobacteriota bacterium]
MISDLRFGARMLLKQPGFTTLAVLTLALGIGATSAVFSLIQGVLLTPPPYRAPDRLVLVDSARTDGQIMRTPSGWAPLQWMNWQKDAKSLESVAAYAWTFNFLVLDDGSESMQGMPVTKDYFRVMGLQPSMGRIFSDSEGKPGSPPVLIISHELWQSKFNGDPNVVGKTLRMSRAQTPPTIIGVMPPNIRFLPVPSAAKEPNYNENSTVQFWVPAVPNPERLKNTGWNVIARLRDGATLEGAQSELAVLTTQVAGEAPELAGVTPRLKSLAAYINQEGNRILLPLLGAAALVLLIACGNVAALLLVRGLQRQQEYAVRSALGIERRALFLQVSTENLLLALLGGTLGVGVAFGLVKVFKLIGGQAIPRLDAVNAGWPVLLFGLFSAIFAAVTAGLFPALRASRIDPVEVLKSAGPKSSASGGERRLLRTVTVVQTALTLALLVGAGLLVRTMVNLANVQSGFDTGHILTMSVTAVQGQWDDFHRRALERVSQIPGVEKAAFAWGVPLTGNNWPGALEIEGQPPPATERDRIAIPLRSATQGYFDLLRLPILEGRDIRASDNRQAPPVAVVNKAFADRYFSGTTAIGKKFWIGGGRDRPGTEIIGIVANGRTADLTQTAEPEIYLSMWQASAFSKHLIVRTAVADPKALINNIRREIYGVLPTAAVENVKTMDEVRGDSLATRTFAMQLLAGFSIIGSLLTVVGIYGVLSLSVAARRRELAIRAAVGAESRDIRNLIFGEGFRLIASGIVAGLVAAFALSRVLQTFLFGVEPTDPLTLAGVAILFAIVAMLACWVPTMRAAAVNPVEALRDE